MLKPEEFWNKASPSGDCLLWIGQINPKPIYGVFPIGGGRLVAHRVAYELVHGLVPKGAHIVRTCENPLCIKPEHLKLANSLKATNPNDDLKTQILHCIEVKDDCWLWKGDRPKSIILPTGTRLLNRGIYELFVTPLRKSQDLSPTCKNEKCLNPKHMIFRERSELKNGKLTLDDVKQIREKVLAGPINIGELVKQYNTSRQTIHGVVYNRSWHDSSYNPPVKIKKVSHKKPLAERFWKKVNKEGDCWNWTAYSSKGFGHFNIDQSPRIAHRVAYELTYGPIPTGMKVLRSCDNELCVKPDHLYLEGKIAAK